MAVQFILGRAGSGKTHWCLEAVRAELRLSQRGPALVLLVPEQATYQTERALATTAGLGGYCRAFVLSFRRLAYQVLLEVGGSALPPLEAAGKQMILRSILRRRAGDLRLFEQSAHQRGFVERLAATLVEMRSYGHGADRLRAQLAMLEERGESDSLLAAKIHDLALVVEEYERFLAERYVDPDSFLDLLAGRLAEKNTFHGARIWIDGFASFTGQEERVLGALMRIAAEMKIALCLDVGVGSGTWEVGSGGESSRQEAEGGRQKAKGKSQKSEGAGGRNLREDCAPDGSNLTSHIPHLTSNLSPPASAFSMFALPRETYQRLNELARAIGQIVLPPLILPDANQPTRFSKSPELAHIERHVFGPVSPEHSRARSDSGQQAPDSDSSLIPHPSSLVVTSAADQRCEVRDAAGEILRLCREEGYRFREIAVIVRDLTPYRALVETIFCDFEIPHFIDVRRDVAHHPLVEFIRSALAVARGWRSKDVIRYAKTDLVALGRTDCQSVVSSSGAATGCQPVLRAAVDRLENYVLEHGIEGEAWYRAEPWTFRRRFSLGEESETRADETGRVPAEINAWRAALAGPLRRFEQKASRPQATVLDISRALYGLLDEIGVADRLELWAAEAERAGRLSEADEHRQVWDAVVALLDQAVAALGNEPVGLDEYREIIEAGLESIRLRLVPPALEQVLVGSIERSRHPEVRAAFVLGMNERLFPQPQLPDVVFGDHERERLARDGLSLGPVSEKRLVHEQFLAYIALTRPSERLYVSYAEADPMGKVLHPSPYLDELKRCFEKHELSVVSSQRPGFNTQHSAPRTQDSFFRIRRVEREEPLDRIAHWRAALAGLAAGLRPGSAVSPQPTAHSLRSTWLALYGTMRREGRFYQALERRVGGLAYENRARLSLPVARRLYGTALGTPARRRSRESAAEQESPESESSISRLETFAACPFKHFARYGLGLEERLRFRLESFDLGLLYHAVLKDVFENLSRGQPLDWGTVEPNRAVAAVEEAIARLAPQLRNEILLSSGRNLYLLDATRAALTAFIRVLIAAAGRDGFRQAAAEVAFGRGEKSRYSALEIPLDEGERLLLRGRIDRIDIADGDPPILRIVDYKSRSRTFRINELAHGLTLQLPAYLLAVERGAARRGKQPTPAGALYVPILRGIQSVAPGEAAELETGDKALDLTRWKARGIFEFHWAGLFDRESRPGSGLSPIVSLSIKQDGTCNASEYIDALPDGAVGELLRWTERQLAEMGRAFLSGQAAVSPYRLGDAVPCRLCEFMSVCRFDGRRQPYRVLPVRRRNEALEWIRTMNAER